MPVVKAQQSFHLRQSAIVMDLADMERMGERIIAEARKKADEILAQARSNSELEGAVLREEVKKEAREEGYKTGHAEGQQTGHDEAVAQTKDVLSKMAARWTGAAETLEQNLPTHAADVKTDLVKLALAIAARVTKQEGIRNRAVASGNVGAALTLVGAGRTVSVHVHPEEVGVMEKYVPELLAKMRQIHGLEIKSDERLAPGDCVLRFGGGEVDARLEGQIARIADELLVGTASEPSRDQDVKDEEI